MALYLNNCRCSRSFLDVLVLKQRPSTTKSSSSKKNIRSRYGIQFSAYDAVPNSGIALKMDISTLWVFTSSVAACNYP